MSTNGLELLLPCPFCGGGVTEFRDNGQVWVGTKYSEPTSVSVRHWCEELPGPSRMIERIGRDKEQAIERWNIRAQTAPSVPEGWIDPNDNTQTRYLPHIGEPVLFSHKGRVYYGKHTGGSFTAGAGVCAQHFVTWDCMWRPMPAAPGEQENNDGKP